jgi:chitodextrinase
MGLWRLVRCGPVVLLLATLARAQDTTPPSVPTGVIVSNIQCRTNRLQWNASTDASGVYGYHLFRNGIFWGFGSAPQTYDSVAANTTYTYEVKAEDTVGNQSALSTPVSITTPFCDTTPPSVPTGLTVTPGACASGILNLAWAASTDTGGAGMRAYYVNRDGVNYVQLGPPPVTAYQDTGLTLGRSYAYTVRSVDNYYNVSAQSASVSGTPPACPTTTTTTIPGDTAAPSVPGGVTATPSSCSLVTVSWTASTDTGGSGLKGYNLYRGSPLTFIRQIAAPTVTIADGGLAADTPYPYAVAAIDNAGNESAKSATVTAFTPACPAGPLWTKRLGGTTNDSGEAVAVDGSGNVIVGGLFSGSVDFGGGPLTSAGGYDIYLAKYTAAGA